MALLKSEFFKIIKIVKENNYSSICMLGKQNVHISKSDLLKISKRYGYEFDESVIRTVPDNCEVFDSVSLFKAYGIEDIVSLDYSDYEGADILFDLNDELPVELCGKYELVLNGGTLEHIYDIARAMDNMNKLVKEGGSIIHISPCAGWVNHGFYSISPTFFQDYYALNEDIFMLKEIYIEFKRCKGACTMGGGTCICRWTAES